MRFIVGKTFNKCTRVLHCEVGGPGILLPRPRCLLFCVVAKAPHVRCVPDDCAIILNMFILVGACVPVNHSAARSRKGVKTSVRHIWSIILAILDHVFAVNSS